jgi:Heavy-metal resistance
MMRTLVVMGVLAAMCLLSQPAAADSARSAYVGQQSRDIKALSDEDIAALRNGDGMGLAKAAELNGYPGPRHVVALVRQLRLSESQAAQVTTIRDRMSTAARPLGDELIDHERTLDQLFAQHAITPERLTAAMAAIGDIQGRLRAVHLAAHLETRAVLSTEQIAQYDKLRGYTETGTPNRDHSTGHSH